MIKTSNFLLSLILLSSTLFCPVIGQNYTTSPYSMFGVGEAVNGTSGENPGMAGTGIGKPSQGYLNLTNPASLGSLDSMSFYFDFGFSGSTSSYKSQGYSEKTTDGNFSSLSMGFKPLKRWALAFGFLPVSSVGYNIKSKNYIEGSNQTEDIWFEGTGGLSKCFIANAFRVTPGITVGINTSIVFGTINHNELQNSISIYRESQTSAFYPEFGVQYKTALNDNIPFNFGVVYGPQVKMKMESKLEVYDNSGYLLSTENPADTDKYLPEYFGLGASVNLGEKWCVAADYLHQSWSSNQTGETGIYYANTHKFAVGAEFIPNVRNATNIFQKVNYRAGFSVENSYLKIRGQNPNIFKTTIGFGLPIKHSSMLNLGLAWEESNATGSSIIKQSTFRINLGIAFTETWFYKRKFE